VGGVAAVGLASADGENQSTADGQNQSTAVITGTTSEITPIVEVDKKLIHGGSVGQTTKLLQIAYEDIIFERTKIV
jgi:branched-subunit amino acid aminotransferase/4-amino-4-deoxychorismate lyase